MLVIMVLGARARARGAGSWSWTDVWILQASQSSLVSESGLGSQFL